MAKTFLVQNSRLSYDPSLRKVARLLQQEVNDGGTTGAAYSYHLAKARDLRAQVLTQREKDIVVFRRGLIPLDSVACVIQMIDADMLVQTDLNTLARLSGYSKSHFIRVFRDLTGSSPHQYVLRHRLESAMRRICDSTRPLTEIAFLCGFASDTHLAHAFSKYFGASPKSFRVSSYADRKQPHLLRTEAERPLILK